MSTAPRIVWLRRDFRLADHPAFHHATHDGAGGGPVIPLFIRDEVDDALGAAPRWRLGLALRHFAEQLRRRDSRLILRSGKAEDILPAVVRETGAGEVCLARQRHPAADARDARVEQALRARAPGVRIRSFAGRILLDAPDEVRTGGGGAFKVFTPFWNALQRREIPAPLPAVARLPVPAKWPRSENLDDWKMAAGMNRGAEVVAKYLRVGEAAALQRLDEFLARRVAAYGTQRDFFNADGGSRLSEHLAWGEISPRTIWHATTAAAAMSTTTMSTMSTMSTTGGVGVGVGDFLRQLGWREFAYQLLFHYPEMERAPWRRAWASFPWRGDNADAERWRRGMTGVPLADAALREMWCAGTMHNRGRMIAASFLCKHLLTDWRVGLAWFAECLTDWDPANNALGWQWAAGCGPDAAPYFRVFNPALQAAKFDAAGSYRRRWVAELSGPERAPASALDFFRAVPRSWGLTPESPYPAPMAELAEGRRRALAALAQWRAGG